MGKMSDNLIELQETPVMIPCPDCLGEGDIIYAVPRRHGPNRDVGYIDVEMEVCGTCSGDGEVERLCDCGSTVTMNMGRDAEVCEECADEDV